MVPVMTGESWETAGITAVTALCLVILFILTITLLSLCTSCQRESFDLEHSIPDETHSTTLVRVVQLNSTFLALNNPAAADIIEVEKDLCRSPADGATDLTPGQDVTPWRNHVPDDNTKRAINICGPPTPKSDTNDIINPRLDSIPPAPKPPDSTSNQTPADPTVSTDTEYPIYSFISQHWPKCMHTYETIRDKKVDETGPQLSPYATNNSTEVHSPRENGPNALAAPVLAEDLDAGPGCTDGSMTYAIVSKKPKRSIPMLEFPLDTEAENPAPPLPEQS